jgi:hypothetical protein
MVIRLCFLLTLLRLLSPYDFGIQAALLAVFLIVIALLATTKKLYWSVHYNPTGRGFRCRISEILELPRNHDMIPGLVVYGRIIDLR